MRQTKEEENATRRKWRARNSEREKLAGKERQRLWAKKNRKIVLDHYGNKCSCCGETNQKFLAIDHINNDGAEHRKIVGQGGGMLNRWIIKYNFPDTFQILCHNCNMAKEIYGICPHKEFDIKNLDAYFGSLILASANSKIDAEAGNWHSNW